MSDRFIGRDVGGTKIASANRSEPAPAIDCSASRIPRLAVPYSTKRRAHASSAASGGSSASSSSAAARSWATSFRYAASTSASRVGKWR